VITNLLSAIPWVGQDIVEFIKNLDPLIFSADSFTAIYLAGLPVIGTINYKSRTTKSNRLSEAEYFSIPKSFLGFLIGFIDGDGYIGIKKSYNDTTQVHLTISIHLDDITTLNYIQSVLKIGKIYSYPNRKSPTVRLIFSKSELQEVLFPLFLHHEFFFLTNTRRAQYNMAMSIFNNNIIKYSELPSVAPVIKELPTKALEYANLPFFKDWIVGFACPSLYPDCLKYSLQNPFFTLKRCKELYKTKIINRESYFRFKENLNITAGTKVRNYSTSSKLTALSNNSHEITNNSLAIVVWGLNLSSTVGAGRFSKQVSNMINFPFFCRAKKCVLIGLLLSDGYLFSSFYLQKPLVVLAMFALFIIIALAFTDPGRLKGLQFRPLSKIIFWAFVANFLVLIVLGAKHVESLLIELGQNNPAFYFNFIILVPL